jgi:hypothetical protein
VRTKISVGSGRVDDTALGLGFKATRNRLLNTSENPLALAVGSVKSLFLSGF